MEKYFVVVMDWSVGWESGVEVIAVKKTAAEAHVVLYEKARKEKEKADKKGWTVYTDETFLFKAGKSGHFNEDGYVRIGVHEVEEKKEKEN